MELSPIDEMNASFGYLTLPLLTKEFRDVSHMMQTLSLLLSEYNFLTGKFVEHQGRLAIKYGGASSIDCRIHTGTFNSSTNEHMLYARRGYFREAQLLKIRLNPCLGLPAMYVDVFHNPARGTSAIFVSVHHAAMDGISINEFVTSWLDASLGKAYSPPLFSSGRRILEGCGELPQEDRLPRLSQRLMDVAMSLHSGVIDMIAAYGSFARLLSQSYCALPRAEAVLMKHSFGPHKSLLSSGSSGSNSLLVAAYLFHQLAFAIHAENAKGILVTILLMSGREQGKNRGYCENAICHLVTPLAVKDLIGMEVIDLYRILLHNATQFDPEIQQMREYHVRESLGSMTPFMVYLTTLGELVSSSMAEYHGSTDSPAYVAYFNNRYVSDTARMYINYIAKLILATWLCAMVQDWRPTHFEKC